MRVVAKSSPVYNMDSYKKYVLVMQKVIQNTIRQYLVGFIIKLNPQRQNDHTRDGFSKTTNNHYRSSFGNKLNYDIQN